LKKLVFVPTSLRSAKILNKERKQTLT